MTNERVRAAKILNLQTTRMRACCSVLQRVVAAKQVDALRSRHADGALSS